MAPKGVESEVTRIQETLKWHTLIGSGMILVFVAASAGLLKWYIPKELDTQKTETVQAIQIQLDNVERLQLDKLSAQIGTLRQSNTKIDAAHLLSLNASLDTVSTGSTPNISDLAWKVKSELLSYKSFLNDAEAPQIAHPIKVPANQQPAPGQYQFALNLKPTATLPPGDRMVGSVAYNQTRASQPADSARLESLTSPQPVGSGSDLIIVYGGELAVVLDNEYMKNVVVRDATVEYDGGPTKLENVYFVNCKFILPQGQPDRGFSETLLNAQAAIDFSPKA